MSRPTAAARRGGDGIRIDASELRELLATTKTVDKKLAAQLRKSIRKAAGTAVKEMQNTVRQPPPGGGRRSGSVTRTKTRTSRGVDFDGSETKVRERVTERSNVREAIARGITVSIKGGQRSAGVSIVASPKNLPARHRAMVKAYNTKTWRHPVFGRDEWVEQSGRPFFAISSAARDEIRRGVAAAMKVVQDALTVRGK